MQDHGFAAYRFDYDYDVEGYLRPRPVKARSKLEDFALKTQIEVLFSRRDSDPTSKQSRKHDRTNNGYHRAPRPNRTTSTV